MRGNLYLFDVLPQRMVAHSPQQGRWPLPLMASVQRMAEGTVVEHQLRELTILKISQLNATTY